MHFYKSSLFQTIATVFLLLFFCENAHALTLYQNYPSQNHTISKGSSITFRAEADDSVGLRLFEWYEGSSIKRSVNASGHYKTDSFTRSFASPGTYYIYFYAYNTNNQKKFIYWKITVTSSSPK